MRIRAKQYVREIQTTTVAISPSDTGQSAVTVALFNIEGLFDFTVSVHTSETACTFPYTVQTAPALTPISLFSQITATNVIASTAGGVTKNTFEGNNQAWLRIILTSASDGLAAGAMSFYLSGNER